MSKNTHHISCNNWQSSISCHFLIYTIPHCKKDEISIQNGIPEFLDSGRWTLDSRRWTLDFGRWTLDAGPWTLHLGS